MNRNGIFQSQLLIGAFIMAALLLTASALTSQTHVRYQQATNQELYALLAQDNVRQLADRVTERVIATNLQQNGCTLSTAAFTGPNGFGAQYQATQKTLSADGTRDPACVAQVTSVTQNQLTLPFTLTVQAQISCQDAATTRLTLQAATFIKQVSGSAASCAFVLTDGPSGQDRLKCSGTGSGATCTECATTPCP